MGIGVGSLSGRVVAPGSSAGASSPGWPLEADD